MMICRPGCGACCIAPSITRPIPCMPLGKPAGVRCVNLTLDNLCRLWGQESYPAFCRGFQPSEEHCGNNASEAMIRLAVLEVATAPRKIPLYKT